MNIWQTLLEQAAANGVWALLSLVLLSFMLRDAKSRESKYQTLIKSLASHVSDLEAIDEKLSKIEAKECKYEPKQPKKAIKQGENGVFGGELKITDGVGE